MTDLASLGLVIDSTQVDQAAKSLDNLSAAGARTEAATNKFQKSWFDQQAGVKATNEVMVVASDRVQKLLDKYDPLGTKLRSLQADFAALNNAAMSGALSKGQDSTIDKVYGKLNEEIAKTKDLMAAAGASVSDTGNKISAAMDKGMLSTVGARRELIVLGHEALTGNFSKMPGSFMVLAERMDITHALLSPLTIGFVAVGTAVVGVAAAMAQGHSEMVAWNNAIQVTNNYAGQTRGTMHDLAESMTKSGEVTIGTAKGIVEGLVASGRIGAESIGTVARLASDFAKSTGQNIDKITPQLIKLFEDPLKGAQELNKSMHFLTVTDLEHIATLERLGETQKTQQLLAEKVAASLPEQAKNVGTLERAYNGLAGAISRAKGALGGWGQDQTTSQMLDKLREQQKSIVDTFNAGRSNLTRQQALGQVDAIQKQIDGLEYLAENEKKAATAGAARAAELDKQNKAQTEVNKSQTHHIQILKDELTLIASAPDSVDKTRREFEIRKEIADAYRAMGAEGRQMTQEQITQQEKLREVGIKGAADEIDTRYKLGGITKAQFDAQMVNNKLDENYSKQLFEQQMANVVGLTKVERQRHLDKLALLKAEWDAIEEKGINQSLVDEKKSYDDIVKAVIAVGDADIKRLTDAVAAQKQHNAEIGKTAAQKALVKQAIDAEVTAQLESDAAFIQSAIDSGQFDEKSRAVYEIRLMKLREEIALRGKLATMLGEASILEADAAAAKKAGQEWDKVARTMESTLADAIANGGQSAARRLKRMFADLILQPILQPISGAFASMMYPGAAQAQDGGAMSTLSDAKTAYSGMNLLSDFGGSVTEMTTKVANTLLKSSNETFKSLGMTLGENATKIGDLAQSAGDFLGYASSVKSLIDGNIATAAGTALGTYFGGPLGAYIGGKIGGWIDSAFAGEMRFGGGYDVLNGKATLHGGPSGGEIDGGNVRKMIESSSIGLNDILKAMGSSSVVEQFTAGLESSKNGKGGTFSGGYVDGKLFGKTFAQADYSQDLSPEEAKKQLVGDLQKSVLDALKLATDIPKSIADQIKDVDVAGLASEATAGLLKSIVEQVTAVKSFQTAVESLPFANLKTLGFDAAHALIAAAGGLNTLNQNLSGFYQNFYTEAERNAQTTKNLTVELGKLGYGLPKTRDEFRSWVEAATDPKIIAGLLSFNSAVSSILPPLDQITGAVTTLKDALSGAFSNLQKSVQAERDSLTAINKAATDAINTRIGSVGESIGKLTSLSNALHASINGSRLPSEFGADRAAAQAQISAALAIARASGVLPSADSLSNALNVVAQPSEQLFTSFVDYQRDFLKQRNDITALADLTDSQLSIEQRALNTLNDQLKATQAGYDREIARLDNILSTAQAQMNVLNGIHAGVLSIPEALKAFGAVVSGAQVPASAAGSMSTSQAAAAVAASAPGAVASYGQQYGGDAYYLVPGINDYASKSQHMQELADQLTHLGAPTTAENEFLRVTGHSQDYWQEVQRQFDAGLHPTTSSIPLLDVGTNYVQRSGLAMIHEGEAVVPKAYNPAAGNEALVAEIRALRSEVAALRSSSERTAANTGAQESFMRRISPDGNSIKVTTT